MIPWFMTELSYCNIIMHFVHKSISFMGGIDTDLFLIVQARLNFLNTCYSWDSFLLASKLHLCCERAVVQTIKETMIFFSLNLEGRFIHMLLCSGQNLNPQSFNIMKWFFLIYLLILRHQVEYIRYVRLFHAQTLRLGTVFRLVDHSVLMCW